MTERRNWTECLPTTITRTSHWFPKFNLVKAKVLFFLFLNWSASRIPHLRTQHHPLSGCLSQKWGLSPWHLSLLSPLVHVQFITKLCQLCSPNTSGFALPSPSPLSPPPTHVTWMTTASQTAFWKPVFYTTAKCSVFQNLQNFTSDHAGLLLKSSAASFGSENRVPTLGGPFWKHLVSLALQASQLYWFSFSSLNTKLLSAIGHLHVLCPQYRTMLSDIASKHLKRGQHNWRM